MKVSFAVSRRAPGILTVLRLFAQTTAFVACCVARMSVIGKHRGTRRAFRFARCALRSRGAPVTCQSCQYPPDSV